MTVYKHVFTFTVLSEHEDLSDASLSDIAVDCDVGDSVLGCKSVVTTKVPRSELKEECNKLGTSDEFFTDHEWVEEGSDVVDNMNVSTEDEIV